MVCAVSLCLPIPQRVPTTYSATQFFSPSNHSVPVCVTQRAFTLGLQQHFLGPICLTLWGRYRVKGSTVLDSAKLRVSQILIHALSGDPEEDWTVHVKYLTAILVPIMEHLL